MEAEYKTIAARSEGIYEEKKSEFIAHLCPVQTSEEAIAFIEEICKENRKARHNVYAYIVREGNATRYSDDGEPQGTAGIPVLDVLRKNDLTDVCCVVTRYFGGVLLGANGLVRAYTHSTAEAVEQAVIKLMLPCYPVKIIADYTFYGKLNYLLPQEDLIRVSENFSDKVELELLVRDTIWEHLRKELIESTGNQLDIQQGELTLSDFSKSKY